MATKTKKTTKTTKKSKKVSSEERMAQHLAYVLSDTYVLAIKTHGYHWNVTGPSFHGLHALFETHYNELTAAADEIAERIRILGLMPDGSMASFLENTIIEEAGTSAMDATDMIMDLLESHKLLRGRLLEGEDLADELDDLGSQDLMLARLQYHEKVIWMLDSLLS